MCVCMYVMYVEICEDFGLTSDIHFIIVCKLVQEYPVSLIEIRHQGSTCNTSSVKKDVCFLRTKRDIEARNSKPLPKKQ
jgi:hypothetical protein